MIATILVLGLFCHGELDRSNFDMIDKSRAVKNAPTIINGVVVSDDIRKLVYIDKDFIIYDTKEPFTKKEMYDFRMMIKECLKAQKSGNFND